MSRVLERFQQQQVGDEDDHRAHNHTGDIADTAQHDRGEDDDRRVEAEDVWKHGGDIGRVERAGDTRNRRAHGERREFGVHQVNAHLVGRQFVFAHGVHARPRREFFRRSPMKITKTIIPSSKKYHGSKLSDAN